jgi:hypothetical protein
MRRSRRLAEFRALGDSQLEHLDSESSLQVSASPGF